MTLYEPTVDEVSTFATIMGIMALVIFSIITIIVIRRIKKQEHKDKTLMDNLAKKAKEQLRNERQDHGTQNNWCEYCGSTNAPNDIKCQGCGAPLNKRK